MKVATAVILIAASGYTYGRDQNGDTFWQQCNSDGYCFGRAENREGESKPFWFQREAPLTNGKTNKP